MASNPVDSTSSLVSTVDRSQGDQGLLLSFEVSDGTGFDSAHFQFESRDANGQWLGSVSASASEWSSSVTGGDARNGKHVVMLEIPVSAEEGSYQLSSFSLRDQAGNDNYFHRNLGWSDSAKAALGIDPDTLNFSVSGQASSADVDLPVISNVSLSDRSVDRSRGENGTLLSFDFTDQTGFASANFGFEVRDSNAQWLDSEHVWMDNWSTLVNGGSDQRGSHVGLINIAPQATAGSYELSYFSLRDEAGNDQHFNREFKWDYIGGGIHKPSYSWSDAAIQALGTDPSALNFSVVGQVPTNGITDDDLPTITNLRLDDNLIDLDAGETGTLLSFGANDATGFARANFGFSLISPTGEWLDSVYVWANSWNSRANGSTDQIQQHIAQLELPASAMAGTYELNNFSIADQAGNEENFHRQTIWGGSGYGTTPTQVWDPEAAAALGIDPSTLKFTVKNSGLPVPGADQELPVISNISFVDPGPNASSPKRTYSAGELIQLDIELADLGVGLAEETASGGGYGSGSFSGSGYGSGSWIGNLEFTSPDGEEKVYTSIDSDDRISGDANQAVYRIALPLDASHQPGEWTLSALTLNDAIGNTSNVQRQYGSGAWDDPVTALQRAHLASRLDVDPGDLSFTLVNPDYVGGPNGVSDTQAPLISDFNLSLSDPSQPDSWTATFRLTDDIGVGESSDSGGGYGSGSFSGSGYGSGSWTGSLGFTSTDGDQEVYTSIDDGDRISGDAQSGLYSVSIPLDATHKPGAWSLTSLHVEDRSRNQFSLYRRISASSEEPVTELQREQMAARLGVDPGDLLFTLVNPDYVGGPNGVSDTQAPLISDFNLRLSDPSQPDSWAATFRLTDATGVRDSSDSGGGYGSGSFSGSGYGSGSWIGNLTFTSPDGEESIYTSIDSDDRISGDAQSGLYSVAIPLDETHVPGEWSLKSINVQDAVGNNVDVSRQSNSGSWDDPITALQREQMAARLGLAPQSLVLNYSNSSYQPASIVDETPPELKRLTWLEGKPASEADVIVIGANVHPFDSVNGSRNWWIQELEDSFDSVSFINASDLLSKALPDLDEFEVAIIPSDQASDEYLRLDGSEALLEAYVKQGGVLSYGVAGWGWAGGAPPSLLSIGGTETGVSSNFQNNAYINQQSSLSRFTEDTHLYANVANHASLSVNSGAVGSPEVLSFNEDDQATTVRYDVDEGHLIVTGLTLESPNNPAEWRPFYSDYLDFLSSLVSADAGASKAVEISIPEQSIQAGQSIAIPISLSDVTGVESLDISLRYDPDLFAPPASGALVTAGSLTPGASFVVNDNPPGQISLSWAGTTPINVVGSGSMATLNLQVRSDAVPGTTTLLDLVSASLNESRIESVVRDGSITILPPSFQVLDVRQMPNGLALGLPEAPDMEAFNLYDGPEDAAFDQADLTLTNGAGEDIALSAHWQDASRELLLLAAEALAPGEYTLTIDSRSDGLISASSGEWLDGNGDGTAGDAYSLSFTKSEAEHSLSIGDTARGAGQALSLNGRGSHDPLTGKATAGGAGLPIHFSTSAAVTSLSGSVSFDSSLFVADALTAGADLPDDWSLSVDLSSPAGQLLYTASGSTAIRGRDQEIVRFQATVAAVAAPPERGSAGNGLYGSTALINASLSSDQLTGEAISVDPGLVALAYAGDSTGNGSLSSLDASRVQRVVVGLDTGFEAYDDINPVLVGDTTGNGGLSSLDASRIQQQVVGLPVDSFPDVP